MMKTVFKYTFSIGNGFWLDMPEGAKILSCDLQYGVPCFWVEVDTDRPTKRYYYVIFGTGHPIADLTRLEFIATLQMAGGDLVWHIYRDAFGTEDGGQ